MPSFVSLTDSGFFQSGAGNQLQVVLLIRVRGWFAVFRGARSIAYPKMEVIIPVSRIRLSDDLLTGWLPAPLGAILS
jgi:hypothetical protein